MKIDITSMFFNSKIEGQTATPAWGTSIGQNKSRDCRIDDFKQEVIDMVVGMTYKSVADLDNLDVSKGSSDRDIITCSVFENVYINNRKIEDAQYVLLLVREHSKSHDGRLLVSYAPYIKYNGIANQSCIDLMQQMLGCTSEGCWFVYDISIKNQSDLYFNAVVVNATAPMVYSNNIRSKTRSEEWKGLIPTDNGSNSVWQKDSDSCLQQIFYGAPGTGKSNTIKRVVDELHKTNFRVTFHPDSDYSTFVGCYKPTMKVNTISKNGVETQEEQIVYRFVPQAFAKAYTAAWNTEDDVYLIIEEINRGNCAQIFGDLFQLLDRNDRGFSEYPVDTDSDLADFICGELKDSQRDFPVGVKEGKKLVLPSNLFIWATMNTSDQSLFPIDSAFKRRWDWKYVKIAEGRDSETKELLNWVVKFDYEEDEKPYTFECSWWQFILAINEKIANATSSDDKKLGYFFCKPKTQDSKEIDAERFVGKVVFYLWNDVFKDEENAIFKVVEGKGDPSFDAFYTEDDKGKTIADTKALRAFMHNVFGEQSDLYTETVKESAESTEQVTE